MPWLWNGTIFLSPILFHSTMHMRAHTLKLIYSYLTLGKWIDNSFYRNLVMYLFADEFTWLETTAVLYVWNKNPHFPIGVLPHFLGDNLVIPYSFDIKRPLRFSNHHTLQISVKVPFVLSFTENAPVLGSPPFCW